MNTESSKKPETTSPSPDQNQQDVQSNQSNWTEMTGKEHLNKSKQTPLDYSRAGQAFVMFTPSRRNALKNLSEKELNMKTREDAIQAIMQRSGKTREQVEVMLAEQF